MVDIVHVSMYEISRLDYTCRNVISICDILYKDIDKDRITSIRAVLSEYAEEFQKRYLELVKELERID